MNPNKTVACPWCKAEIGAGCVNPDGTAFKAGVHMARYMEVQKVKRAAS